jgi:hypothetical protein
MSNLNWDPVEYKYLTVKTEIFIRKLKEKYPEIIAMCIDNDPGNLRVGFREWGIESKIMLLLGNKNQNSHWVNNVVFKTKVKNNSSLSCESFNKEFEDFCVVIDDLMIDFRNLK